MLLLFLSLVAVAVVVAFVGIARHFYSQLSLKKNVLKMFFYDTK